MTSELRRVAKAAARMAEARRKRDDAIREASAAGHSLREIARAAGVAHTRILAIVRETTGGDDG
jgi:hypothetical protein